MLDGVAVYRTAGNVESVSNQKLVNLGELKTSLAGLTI